MLAVSSGRTLALIEQAVLKSASASSSPLKQTALDVQLSALTWNADNSALFVAAEGALRKYDRLGHFEKTLRSPGGTISALAVRDKGPITVYYSRDNKAYELDCDTGAVSATFEICSSPIKSLSVSVDGSHLAIASATECTVYNLSDSTHITLEGFPSDDTAEVSVCAFHSHSEMRLFVGYGQHLLIYDTSKPSVPVKYIPLKSSAATNIPGEIVAISCSPFSKSLVVVGLSSGLVYLVDLEKERGLFKTIDVKQSLSSLVFTADGAAMLMGSEDGHLLVQDLRMINKGQGPKKIVVSAEGDRVIGLAVQKKLKNLPPAARLPTTPRAKPTPKQSPKPIRPLTTQDINVKFSASRQASASTAQSSPLPKVRTMKQGSATGRTLGTSMRRTNAPKEMGTPALVRPRRMAPSPLTSSMTASENYMNVSIQMETLPTPVPMRRKAMGKAVPAPKISPRTRLNMMAMSASGEKTMGNSPVHKLNLKASQTETASSVASKKSNADSSTQPNISSTLRSRKEGLAPRLPSSRPLNSSLYMKERDHGLRGEPRSRTCSTISMSTTSASAAIVGRRQTSRSSAATSVASRAPSPDKMDVQPVSQRLAMFKKGRRNVRGVEALRIEASTPDVMDGWPLSAMDGSMEDERRKVDFEFSELSVSVNNASSSSRNRGDVDEREKMQIPPKPPQVSASTALQLTPLRALGLRQTPSRSSASSLNPHALPNTPGSSAKMQDFLRTLMTPTLADFHQETRSELLGLHLDLLRLGRDWKRDMREAIGDAWTGEVQILREENKKLREENERLRRGLC